MNHPHPPPSDPLHTLRVQADREGLARCLAWSVTACAHLGLGNEDSHALRLAVEEACTNIVAHGYPADAPGPLSLAFVVPEPGWVEARIGDQARPFHPDEATEPDVQASADERAVGGLGWFFIKQVMTEVDYRSTPQGNCLRLRRRLTAPPTACPPADPTAPAHTAP